MKTNLSFSQTRGIKVQHTNFPMYAKLGNFGAFFKVISYLQFPPSWLPGEEDLENQKHQNFQHSLWLNGSHDTSIPQKTELPYQKNFFNQFPKLTNYEYSSWCRRGPQEILGESKKIEFFLFYILLSRFFLADQLFPG